MDRAVEQLRVVGRRDEDGVARQRVDLKQQRTDNALDLASLVLIATLLGERVELVEEHNAAPGTGELEHGG